MRGMPVHCTLRLANTTRCAKVVLSLGSATKWKAETSLFFCSLHHRRFAGGSDFLFNPPIAIEFKTGAECEQDGWQCVAYRWQTLIGGSFAIFAAAIAWTSLEIQNIRAAKQSREARTRRLRRTLMDMEYLRDTANNIHKCFLAICPNDAGPFNLTHKSIGNCRQNPSQCQDITK